MGNKILSPASPALIGRATEWCVKLREHIRRMEAARVMKCRYGVGGTAIHFEEKQVGSLNVGDYIKLRLSNRSSSEKSRLWELVKITPRGIASQLTLRCPKTEHTVEVLLRIDFFVLTGLRRC